MDEAYVDAHIASALNGLQGCTRTLRASSGDHSMDNTMWCPNPVELRTVSDCTRSGAAAASFVPIMPGTLTTRR